MQKSKIFQVNFMVLLNEEIRANILALDLISAMKEPKKNSNCIIGKRNYK